MSKIAFLGARTVTGRFMKTLKVKRSPDIKLTQVHRLAQPQLVLDILEYELNWKTCVIQCVSLNRKRKSLRIFSVLIKQFFFEYVIYCRGEIYRLIRIFRCILGQPNLTLGWHYFPAKPQIVRHTDSAFTF